MTRFYAGLSYTMARDDGRRGWRYHLYVYTQPLPRWLIAQIAEAVQQPVCRVLMQVEPLAQRWHDRRECGPGRSCWVPYWKTTPPDGEEFIDNPVPGHGKAAWDEGNEPAGYLCGRLPLHAKWDLWTYDLGERGKETVAAFSPDREQSEKIKEKTESSLDIIAD